MHEYEFRLVVQSPTSFEGLLEEIGRERVKRQTVIYIHPHIRYRRKRLETKQIVRTERVYCDGLWFKWVHSLETPYSAWTSHMHRRFVETLNNRQCPFDIQTRTWLKIDEKAQMYTFLDKDRTHTLIFEWEYGTFPHPIPPPASAAPLLASLRRYRTYYDRLRPYAIPRYVLRDSMTRKSVRVLPYPIQSDRYAVARKWDGTFGFLYSYPDRIVEKWEPGVVTVRTGVTLGDGIVFSAEKCEDAVVILDVYQVRGHPVARWIRRDLFFHYFPALRCPEGFRVQTYVTSVFELPEPDQKTDGIIFHDLKKDRVFKVKTCHSLDVVYVDGYFHAGKVRFKPVEEHDDFENGRVYEVSVADGTVVRQRHDRLTGNTWKQIVNILRGSGWNGPRVENIPVPKKKRKRGGEK